MLLPILAQWLVFSAFAGGFSATTPLPQAKFGHSLLYASGHLYTVGGLGGVDGALIADEVLMAPVDGGAAGAWTQTTPLPAKIFYHSGLALGDELMVLGGYHYDAATGLTVSSEVYVSQLGSDGTPGPWRETTPLPEPLFFTAAAAWNGAVYVAGGWNGSALSSQVRFAKVQADGTLSAWTELAPLPEAIYTHAAVSHGTLYVLGGVDNGGQTIMNTVWAAKINADGTIGPWSTTTPLPNPLSNHAASFADGRVIVSGGWTGVSPTQDVVAASVNPDQSLGPWSALGKLPDQLYLHAQAVSDGYLFVSGGTDGSSPQSAVYSMPLPKPADSLAPVTTLSIGAPQYAAAPTFVTPATPLSLSASDSGSGVASTEFAVDAGAFSAYSAPFELSGDGLHTVRYFSTDAAGNEEAVETSSVAVDATAPVSSLSFGAPKAVLEDGSVVVSSRTPIGVSAQDPLAGGAASGVASVLAGVDGAPLGPAGTFTLAAEGAHAVRTQAVDNLGNAEAPHASSVSVDATAPATTLTIAPAPVAAQDGGAPYVGAGASVSFSAADPVSGGVASGVNRTDVELDGAPFSALSEGAHVLAWRSVDNVGNAEAWKSLALRVDLTAPQSTLSVGAPVVSLFGVDLVTPESSLTIAAADPVSNGVASGVAGTDYSVDGAAAQAYAGPFHLSAGRHTVAFWSVDRAGNAETAQTATLSVSSFMGDALAGADSLTLSGGASAVGPARTNGALSLSGRARIDGDAWARSAEISGKNAGVTGKLTTGAATLVTDPLDLAAARASAQAAGPGGALALSGSQARTLGAGRYYFTSLTLSGKAALSFSGRAEVFVDGPISISGGASLNAGGSADDVWIVCAGDSVALSGGSSATAHIYAPAAAVSSTGEDAFAGRIYGKSVTLAGRASLPSETSLPAVSHRSSGPEREREPRVERRQAPAPENVAEADTSDAQPDVERSQPSAPQGGTDQPFAGALAPVRVPRTVKNLLKLPDPLPNAAFSLATGDGASLRTPAGSGVVIPQGALSSGLGVSVEAAAPADPAEERRRDEARSRRELTAAGPAVQFGPEGTRFAKSVTIELPYDPSSVPPGSQLVVEYWNPATQDWQDMPSSVDEVSHVVRAQTTHFSLYQVHAQPAAAASTAAGPFALGAVYAYPNPARSGRGPVIHVEAPGADSIEISVYDIGGRLVGQGAGPDFAWDVSGVGSGVYVFTATAKKAGSPDLRAHGRVAVIK